MYRSLSTIKADLARAEFGITGRGIVWAIVSTGVDGDHPHFRMHSNTALPAPLRHMDYARGLEEEFWSGLDGDQSDEVLLDDRFAVRDPVDWKGLGTSVAGVIAGQSTDPRDGQFMPGLAPEAKILSLKVFGGDGQGVSFSTIAALRGIQRLNERAGQLLVHGVVVPLSINWDVANFACGHSPVCAAVDRLVNSGVVVVTCSGNSSFDFDKNRVVEGGISDPGNAELAITVGASHRTAPQIYGPSYFSCRGPTADGRRKPDLLAPGEKITSCQAGGQGLRASPEPSAPAATRSDLYVVRDGTGIAAAHVAGAAAALLSAQPDLIGKPLEVKELLKRTAVDLRREPMYQGAGLLDVLAAVRAARGGSQPTANAAVPLKVFCSYSHNDKALWREFRAHLSPLERGGRIEVWSDEKIEAGQRWEAEIYRKLNEADIVLLLISAYFVESEFCFSKELERAVERVTAGTARMVPVRVRPVSLKGTVLADIQALPPGGKPITSFGDPHEGWALVVEALYDIVDQLAARKKAGLGSTP